MPNSLNIKIDIRSSLNFIVFAIVVIATSFFLLLKIDTAIREIDKIGNSPLYRGLREEETGDTSMWKTYREKIVYTADQSVDTAPFKKDCAARGGRFNECGSACPPDAMVCAEVCAFTCELKNE